jgi:hypothetical protein
MTLKGQAVFLLILKVTTISCLGVSEAVDHALNDIVGFHLFQRDGDGRGNESLLRHRDGWAIESRENGKSSYRKYSEGEETSIGGRVFSRNAVFSDGELEKVTIVLSNKGDSRERGSKLNVLIREDFSRLERGISSLLGAGSPHVDRSGGIGESGRKWTYRDFSLFLTQQSGVYVRFSVFAKGAMERSRELDSVIRAKNLSRVERRSNGDVILSDFPMIDQGRKGYCVPASWARVLSFMGVSADMYSLGAATLSETGGTDILKAAAVAAEVARNGGRKVSFPSLKPTIREISTHIDKGVPILWAMVYSDAFAQRGGRFSGRGERGSGRLKKQGGEPHLCIIIGYNVNSGEVAITDSWGSDHRERWYREIDVQDVSLGKFYTVEY